MPRPKKAVHHNVADDGREQTAHSYAPATIEARFPSYGSTFKERLRLLLDEPSSSPQAFAVAVLIGVVIATSSLLAIIATIPAYYGSRPNLWRMFEYLVIVVFSVELAARVYAHTTTRDQFWRFCRSWMTIFDALAVAPYFLELAIWEGANLEGMQRFTVFRLFRLFRLLRCYSYSSLVQLSIDALVLSVEKSKEALLALLIFISFIMIVFSTVLYLVERGVWDPNRGAFFDSNGNISRFGSIPAAFWFVAEVLTTVGLGDVAPITTSGKIVTTGLMLFSLLIIALPSIVIGRNFAESWAWLRTTRPIRGAASIAPTPALSAALPLNAGLATAGTIFVPASLGLAKIAEDQQQHHHGAALTQVSASHSALAPTSESIVVSPSMANVLPPPAVPIEEHGEVMLGILQELQRQNQMIERLLLVNGMTVQWAGQSSLPTTFGSGAGGSSTRSSTSSCKGSVAEQEDALDPPTSTDHPYDQSVQAKDEEDRIID